MTMTQAERPLPHSLEADRAHLAGQWPSASEAEKRLLDFFGSLVLDLARTHSRVTQPRVALWIAQVAVGTGRR